MFNLRFNNSIFFFKLILALSLNELILLINSNISGFASSAAADGVGALKSATKSAIVKSVSWPTAEIIGIFDS